MIHENWKDFLAAFSDDFQYEETDEEYLPDILAAANDAGFPVSKRQFDLWKKEGFILSGRTEWLGHGLGSESFYPSGTTDRVVEIPKALQEKRSFSHVAWKLWGLGYDIPKRIREETKTSFSRQEKADRFELRRLQKKSSGRKRRTEEETAFLEVLGKEKGRQAYELFLRISLKEVTEPKLTYEERALIADVLSWDWIIPRDNLHHLVPLIPLYRSGSTGLAALKNSTDEDLIRIRNDAKEDWDFIRDQFGLSVRVLPGWIFRTCLTLQKGDHHYAAELEKELRESPERTRESPKFEIVEEF